MLLKSKGFRDLNQLGYMNSPLEKKVTGPIIRAVTKALIGGGGGVDIHILAFWPTNFFWNQLSLRLISKEIRRAECEYMNMHPQLTL